MTATALRCTSASEVADAVREAAARGTPLRIVGRGTWLDAGRPVADGALPLDVRALDQVHAYTPGDLTCTVGAGLTLAALDAMTAEHGQWCPLLPWGGDAGTVGATLATATAGPCAAALGLPRDLALGLEVVDGRGSVVHAGGAVVKNVAGFDLVRLNVGAWGSLGVITRASLRLRARPAADVTWALPFDGGEAAVARIEALRTGPLAPIALELVNDAASRALGLGDGAHALVRGGGNAAFVRALAAALGPGAREVEGAAWMALRTIEPAAAGTWRESVAPARWPALARAITRPGDDRGRAVFAHVSVARGVLRVSAATQPGDDPRLAGAAWRTSAVALRERPALPPLGDGSASGAFRVVTTDALARRVREAFDPSRVLNPGILG
jgi:glycolate oxidase FAD binding subunit